MAARSRRNKMRYNLHRITVLLDQITRQLRQIDEMSEGREYVGKASLPCWVELFEKQRKRIEMWRASM